MQTDVPQLTLDRDSPNDSSAIRSGVRAILIHQAFCGPSDPGGTRHYEFARRIVAQGHSFVVVASDVSYLTGKQQGSHRWFSRESVDGIEILRARTYRSTAAGFVRRVMGMCSFAFSSLAAAMRGGAADVVIGTTPPIFQAASACLLAMVKGKPFILEIRDLWPAFAIDMGILKNPFLIRLSRWLERFIYSRAAHLVVNSPAYRDYLIGQNIAADRITVVANGVDPTMFDPNSRGESVRAQFGLNGKFVVTYAGALGMANDIDTILRAAARVREKNPNLVFLIVGDGKERSRLQEKAADLGLDNVVFTGAQPKETMVDFLAASDACVATLRDIPMFRTTYPNKVFDYMAAGRPILLAIDGVIRRVVEDADGGIFVPPGNDRLLADAALDLASDPGKCRSMGCNSRSYVEQHFNRDHQAQAFMQLVVQVARNGTYRSDSHKCASEAC